MEEVIRDHNLSELETFKIVLKEIKYWYDIQTDREFVERLGAKSRTLVSDLFSGKASVNKRLKDALAEKFQVNKKVFEGDPEMFTRDCKYNAQIIQTINGSGECHVHAGHNNNWGERAISGERVVVLNNNQQTSPSPVPASDASNVASNETDLIIDTEHIDVKSAEKIVNEFANLTKEMLADFNRQVDSLRADASQQREQFLAEIKSQREMFQQILTLLTSKNS